jgi:hypothetical protein
VQLHTPDWISESLKNKKRISENEFRLYHTGSTPKKAKVKEIKEEQKLRAEPQVTAKKKLKFACEKDQSETFNHNEGNFSKIKSKELTNALEKLESIYLLTGDQWRSMAYRKSIRVLKSLDFRVKSISEVENKGIGEKTTEKIKEFLNTGTIQRLGSFVNRLTKFRQIRK